MSSSTTRHFKKVSDLVLNCFFSLCLEQFSIECRKTLACSRFATDPARCPPAFSGPHYPRDWHRLRKSLVPITATISRSLLSRTAAGNLAYIKPNPKSSLWPITLAIQRTNQNSKQIQHRKARVNAYERVTIGFGSSLSN